jgi:hypothetical protein
VSTTGMLGLLFTLLFVVLMIAIRWLRRKAAPRSLRPIQAFERLQRAIGLSVEDGTRLHFSVGRGTLIGQESAIALAGMALLQRIIRVISVSDRLPVMTAGDGGLSVLGRDAMQHAYREIGEVSQYDPQAGQLTGPTPFSYAAGALPIMMDEQVSANVVVGNIGAEGALLAETAERSGSMIVGGTDDLTGQAVFYVMGQDVLVGEEAFAGGAYLRAGDMHAASLSTQDIFRWLLTGAILLGVLLKIIGLDQVITTLLAGGS